jgi:hypothetical protein
MEVFDQGKSQIDDDTIHLDTSLTSLLGRLQYFAQGDLYDKPALFSELKNAIDLRAGAMSCVRCSQFPPQVCNGNPDVDDQIVNAGAACLAPLAEMFDIANAIARHYYFRYGTSMDGNPEVFFGTENFSHSQSKPDVKPHDLPVRFFVNGETMYFDQPGQMRAKVVLKIPVRAFDTNTYLSTLYILFHECIVHAFRAINPEASRTGTKDEDRFVEGWMDWISFEILTQVLNGDWPILRRWNLSFLRARQDRALRFHMARIDPESSSKFASSRATGRSAAIKVSNFFKSACPKPWEKFLQMSFDLNMMSDFDEATRESFVTVLDFLEDFPEEHKIIADLLTKYLQTNDLPALINSVVPLESQFI